MIETKKSILENTHKLFMQYGIKSVTMSDIARKLGISKKTLYTYFDKKEDLIDEGIKVHIAEEKEKVNEISANAKDAIDEMMSIYILIYHQRGISEKLYRENFNPIIVAQLYIAKMEVMVEQDNFSKQEYPATEYYKEFAMYHLNAILNDKGRKYLKEKFNN